MEYNVGDKVRLTEAGAAYFASGHRLGSVFPVGTTGVVVGADDVDLPLVKFNVAIEHQTNGGGKGWWMKVCQIELIEDKPKFSEGDKVRVVKARVFLNEAANGAEGVVTAIDGNPRAPIRIKLTKTANGTTSGIGGTFSYAHDELALIEDKPAFAVGDKVSVTCKGGCCVNRKGVVAAKDDELREAWRVRFDDGVTKTCGVSFIHHEQTAIESAPVASTTTPQEEGIGRFNGATVDGARFEREGERVTVYVGTRKDSVSTTMMLAHFNEVARILNEEAK